MPIKIQKVPKSKIEITGDISAEEFEGYFARALQNLGAELEIPGFRKGKAPETVLVKHIPESKILEEMAELALRAEYPKILESEKIDAIDRPEIMITKLARGNPLEFKIITAVLPEVKLPDYKKIAAETLKSLTAEGKNTDVSDEEFENTIEDIRKSRAPKDKPEEVPELNDEFVRALGPFENVEDFKQKLRANLKLEKENLALEKSRLKIIENIMEKTGVELPETLIDAETEKILYKMEADVAAMGLQFEDYLKHLNKTRDNLREEFRKDGEKKAKLSLALFEIAKTENIKADEAEVEKEVSLILEHYKDADPSRARAHAENVLTNEKIFRFLENQAAGA